MKPQPFNKEELELYALIYAANMDMNISKEELTDLIAEVNPKTFEHVYQQFLNDNDFEHINRIIEYKNRFLDSKEKIDQFLASIHEIFMSDKKLSGSEVCGFSLLKKILS